MMPFVPCSCPMTTRIDGEPATYIVENDRLADAVLAAAARDLL